MIQSNFVFDQTPWEQLLLQTPNGGQVDGLHLLTLLEAENEDALQLVWDLMEERNIMPTIEGLDAFSASGDAAIRLSLEKKLVQSKQLPNGLEENDPLRLYLEEIAALPAVENITDLVQTYLNGNESVQPNLANAMLPCVVQQAFALAGRGVLLMDLLQEGSLGLWQGILSYCGGNFEEHCSRFIQRGLNWALLQQARQYGVGQKMRQAMEDYRATDEQLLMELGRTATPQELAEALHMSEQELTAVAEMLANARRMHMAKKEPEPEEEELAQTQAVEDTAYFQMRQRIADLLSTLSHEEAKLLTLRFGLEAGLPMSVAEVARQMNLTPEDVTQREAAALMKLRNER